MRSMVEGYRPLESPPPGPFPTNLNYPHHNRLHIVQNYLCGYPRGRDPLRAQPCGPPRVTR